MSEEELTTPSEPSASLGKKELYSLIRNICFAFLVVLGGAIIDVQVLKADFRNAQKENKTSLDSSKELLELKMKHQNEKLEDIQEDIKTIKRLLMKSRRGRTND